MPTGWAGQLITFASEIDPDEKYSQYVWVKTTRRTNTIRKIAAVRGHPEWAAEILKINKGRDVLPHPKRKPHHKRPPVPKLRSATQRLRVPVSIRLPGTMKQGFSFSVFADDKPPHITDGYAKYQVVDVPGRVGINQFQGYNPIVIDIPIQFENYGHSLNAQGEGIGTEIENDIKILERMAGRGDYPGSHYGPPAVIRVSVTDAHGNIVPLLPPNYQWSTKNQTAPLFRVSSIAWDDSPERNSNGYRVRQKAVVTVTQYTPLVFVTRSSTARAKTKKKPALKKRSIGTAASAVKK